MVKMMKMMMHSPCDLDIRVLLTRPVLPAGLSFPEKIKHVSFELLAELGPLHANPGGGGVGGGAPAVRGAVEVTLVPLGVVEVTLVPLGVVEVTLQQLPNGSDSSGCIEVYASCVEAAFSLLTTRGLLHEEGPWLSGRYCHPDVHVGVEAGPLPSHLRQQVTSGSDPSRVRTNDGREWSDPPGRSQSRSSGLCNQNGT
ncbi:hypothetical protein EYF80_043575 [Liparis tanakae]|uniref:Uncharacterized protein n=1 Tax=Liparis tanakae TaxID=230148 RepID=A0A4Z2FZF7_9TELE|nr:hypothetical protein EYF80_043575 [Liparis tanakae]